jgi:cysteine synthase A
MWWPRLSLPDVHVPWPTRHLFYGVALGVGLSLASSSAATAVQQRRRRARERALGLGATSGEQPPIEIREDEVVHGVLGLVGNTPLVRIESLSRALGCDVLGKAEWLNPGGSVKDRVALRSTHLVCIYALYQTC